MSEEICRSCSGYGELPVYSGGRNEEFSVIEDVTCWRCGGSGMTSLGEAHWSYVAVSLVKSKNNGKSAVDAALEAVQKHMDKYNEKKDRIPD